MKNFLRPFVTFNRSERKGMIVLAGIIGACILFTAILPLIVPAIYPELQYYAALPFDSSLQQNTGYALQDRRPGKTPAQKMPLLQPFDPNGLAASEWVRLGLSPKQAAALKSYEARIKGFRSKEDLKKCYVLPGELYQRLEPWLRIPAVQTAAVHSQGSSSVESPAIPEPIDLNLADTTLLKTLPGIGSILAARIVKFREGLGGFHSLSQLRDVYGLSEETYLRIEKSLTLSHAELKQISVNYGSVTELASLPYIGRQTAWNIVHYREKNGFFRSIRELAEKGLINDETFSKCVPYLLL